MQSLSVTEHLSTAYQPAYYPCLYSTREYLEGNNGLPQRHFYLIDENTLQALGHIAFSLEEGEAMSPAKAPFGGFELAPELQSTAFLFFLNEVKRRLEAMGIRYVHVQLAAKCYEPLCELMATDLTHAGFSEKGSRVNHAIPVDDRDLIDKVDAMERRRLRKAAKGKLTFRLAKLSEFTTFFDFIQHHREAKGHVLSMNRDALKQAIKASPEHYLMAGVYQDDRLIGASVLIRVSSRVVYNFFPAHDMAFNNWSPMVFLLACVYQWCQQEQVEWLDLGTSYLDNKPNKTLITFKEHMGGQPFESVIFRKTLSS